MSRRGAVRLVTVTLVAMTMVAATILAPTHAPVASAAAVPSGFA